VTWKLSQPVVNGGVIMLTCGGPKVLTDKQHYHPPNEKKR
jgi:hypothetical protein